MLIMSLRMMTLYVIYDDILMAIPLEKLGLWINMIWKGYMRYLLIHMFMWKAFEMQNDDEKRWRCDLYVIEY